MSNWIGEAYVNSDGTYDNVSSSMYSVTKVSTGVYKCILDNSQDEGDVFTEVVPMAPSGGSDEIIMLTPRFLTESGRPGVYVKFIRQVLGTAIDCRFRVTFYAKD